MADNIGSLAVSLALDASAFTSGLQASEKQAKAFGSKMGDSFGGLGKEDFAAGKKIMQDTLSPTEKYGQKMGELDRLLRAGAIDQTAYNRAAAAAKADLDGAAGGMTTLSKAAVAAAVTVGSVWAAFKIGEAAFSWMMKGIDDIAELARESEKLGISVTKLSDFQFAAGRASGSLDSALTHLNLKLQEAAAGSAEARRDFALFGLDGKALAEAGLDVAVEKIADKVKDLDNAADRTALTEKLMFKGAADLIPMLSDGAAGLDKAAEKARLYGMELNSVGAGQALQARGALDDLGKVFEGLQRTASVKIAPLITAAAEATAAWLSTLNLKKAIGDGFDWLKSKIPEAVHGLGELAKWFEHLEHKAEAWGNKLQDVFDAIADPSKFSGLKGAFEVEDSHDRVRDAIGDQKIDAAVKAAQAAIASTLADVDKSAEALADKLNGPKDKGPSLSSLNAIADQMMAAPFAGLNIFDQYTNKLKAVYDALGDGAKAAQAFATASSKMAEELQKEVAQKKVEATNNAASDYDRFAAKIAELKGLNLAPDVLAIDAAKEFEGLGLKSLEVMHPAALEQGSQGAYDAILNFQNQGKQGDIQVQLLELAKEANQKHDRQIAQGERLLDAFNRIFVKKA